MFCWDATVNTSNSHQRKALLNGGLKRVTGIVVFPLCRQHLYRLVVGVLTEVEIWQHPWFALTNGVIVDERSIRQAINLVT